MTQGRTDARRYSPAIARNRDAILEILRQVLPAEGVILEVGCGSGEHAVHFAPHFPKSLWQPSDPSSDSRKSTAAWIESSGVENVRPPLDLDVRDSDWPVGDALAAVVSINMIHISPWSSCQGLLAAAGRLLADDGALFLYGPFRIDGAHTAPSNAAFDESLRSQDPEWGVRDLGDVADAAARCGLVLSERFEMPANNLSVVFRRTPGRSGS